MFVVANVDHLASAGIITPSAAETMRRESRDTMMALAVNALLTGGILTATGGLIFWLKDALSVAMAGSIFLLAGLLTLFKGSDLYRMFGNAAALIGAGMLIGGAGLELVDKVPDLAGTAMLAAGALIAGLAGLGLHRLPDRLRLAGSIFLMGVALHLAGGYFALDHMAMSGLPVALFHLYAALLIGLAGWHTDVRLVTALAIAPFAQMLDTGTAYFHAAYVFYSPEPTLTILQMGLAVAAATWAAGRLGERDARHARIAAMMAFVVANLSALVGSLFGDVVGSHLWGPEAHREGDWETRQNALEAFRETALTIPDHVFSVLWAVALAALVFLSAHRNNRGLFNASLTFAGIHAYTQLFETFGDEPLAWVIGGLVAIPAAWTLWRINQNWSVPKQA